MSAYDLRISDWGSYVCSSDLQPSRLASLRFDLGFNDARKTRIRRTLGFEQNVRVPDFEGVAGGDEESEAIKLAQLLDHRRADDAALVIIAALFGHAELHAGGVVAACAALVAAAAVGLFINQGRNS